MRSIDESCQNLIMVLEGYQDRICGLAHEESAAGRFLKECAKVDKTRAGKMMAASGKTLSYTAQQRIQLRNPLVRLYQEVETFQYRAVADTMLTVEKMEKSRTAYRAALLWMKDVSQQLDPDTYKQLDKFRKVQGHVRKTKIRFDKLKVDTLQKIDLLSASRCNMYSNALVGYQNALLLFWEKTSKTMSAVADSFKGYQYYEFTTLKELAEASKKLAEDTSNDEDLRKIFDDNLDDDKDRLIFFEADYRDEESDRLAKKGHKKGKSGKTHTNSSQSKAKHSNQQKSTSAERKDNPLLDLSFDQNSSAGHSSESGPKNSDLLTSYNQTDDLTLLNDILNAPTTPVLEASGSAKESSLMDSLRDAFMPSQLIDLNALNRTMNSMSASIAKNDKKEENKKLTLNPSKEKVCLQLSHMNGF